MRWSTYLDDDDVITHEAQSIVEIQDGIFARYRIKEQLRCGKLHYNFFFSDPELGDLSVYSKLCDTLEDAKRYCEMNEDSMRIDAELIK